MPKLHYKGEIESFVKGQGTLIISEGCDYSILTAAQIFIAYKIVDCKVKSVSRTFLQDALVRRTFPHNPLERLSIILPNPLDFTPIKKIISEKLKLMKVNSMGFFWPEEEKFMQVIVLNEAALALKKLIMESFERIISLHMLCLVFRIQLGRRKIFPFHLELKRKL